MDNDAANVPIVTTIDTVTITIANTATGLVDPIALEKKQRKYSFTGLRIYMCFNYTRRNRSSEYYTQLRQWE